MGSLPRTGRELPGARPMQVLRTNAAESGPSEDLVAVEEPLEIRVDDVPLATLMRTPGDDRDLTLGFLYGEGIIDRIEDVGALSLCPRSIADRHAAAAVHANTVTLFPSTERAPRPAYGVRFTAAYSSCGVCGKQSIEEAMARRPPPGPDPPAVADGAPWSIAPGLLAGLPRRMREHQLLFSSTGSVHAAAIFDTAGEIVVVREDIGRHNAVDKVVGFALLSRSLPAARHVLIVSGRVSFEIVQKAYRAGIPFVAAVSAASSLAVDLARSSHMTVVGFLRDCDMTVYCGEHRVAGLDARAPADR